MEETTRDWNSFTEDQQHMICTAMCDKAKYKDHDYFMRMLNLGCPAIVLGKGPEGNYCRIAQKSEAVMKIIFDSYA